MNTRRNKSDDRGRPGKRAGHSRRIYIGEARLPSHRPEKVQALPGRGEYIIAAIAYF